MSKLSSHLKYHSVCIKEKGKSKKLHKIKDKDEIITLKTIIKRS